MKQQSKVLYSKIMQQFKYTRAEKVIHVSRQKNTSIGKYLKNKIFVSRQPKTHCPFWV